MKRLCAIARGAEDYFVFVRLVDTDVIPGWCVNTGPQMRNCASGNLEIPGAMLRIAPE